MKDYRKGVPRYDSPIAMPNLEKNPAEFTLEDYFRNLDKQFGESVDDCHTDESAKSKQVGGNHYKKAIQPWDIISEWELDFWEGNVLKYLLRWKFKDGLQDLKKARHYLDYLIEREESNGKGK